MLVLQRRLPTVPGVLIAVVASMVAVIVFDLGNRGVSLVGVLPSGLPRPTIPRIEPGDLPILVGGAIGIAIVSLADTISTSSAFATRSGQDVDANQEMVGIGAANVAAGLFQGFPISTSASRSFRRGARGREDTADGRRSGPPSSPSRLSSSRDSSSTFPSRRSAPSSSSRRFRWPISPVCAASGDSATTSSTWRWLRSSALPSSVCCRGSRSPWSCRSSSVFRRAWGPYRTVLGDVEGLPGLPRHPDVSRCRAGAWSRHLPVRRPAVLRQRPHVP